MAKTIKFNLNCDGHHVRTLEDLREHFSMEDVLEYLNNGMLARWLDIRGYTAEKEQVEQITADNDRDRLWALVNIFDIDADQKEVTERAQQLDWKNRQKALSAAYQASGESRQRILDDYFSGYKNAVETILTNLEDYGSIKSAVADIDEHYQEAFDLQYKELIERIYGAVRKDAHMPTALLALFTRPHMRAKYLPEADTPGSFIKGIDSFKGRMRPSAVLDLPMRIELSWPNYKQIMEYAQDTVPKEYDYNLKPPFHVVRGEFGGGDKLIQRSGQQVMVIKVESSDRNYVQVSAANGENAHSYYEINGMISGRFVLLDGLRCKLSQGDALWYMEV